MNPTPMPTSVIAVIHAASNRTLLDSPRRNRSSSLPTIIANAGNAGNMYPGSFDSEKEKNNTGTIAHIHAKASTESRIFVKDRNLMAAGIRKKVHGAITAIETIGKK